MTLIIGNRVVARHASRVARNRKFGFTLLELMLVVCIIAVLAGFSFPLIKKTVKTAEFRAAADKVYLFLDYAKTQSIIQNMILEAKLELDERKLVLLSKASATGEEKLLGTDIFGKFDVKLEPERIIFYPDGTLDAFELVILDARGRKALISSQGIDGKITLER